MYRRFGLPYEQRIFAAVHEMGALARLHICGNTNRILADMAASGADIIDIDWMVDMRRAGEVFGDGPAVCGNFDPVAVMLQGTPRRGRAGDMGLYGNGWSAQPQRSRLRDSGWHASREPGSPGARLASGQPGLKIVLERGIISPFRMKGEFPMIRNFGPTELIIILVIIILLFGVGRIGKISKELGGGIRAFPRRLEGRRRSESRR